MEEINALGKRCPQPILDLARAMKEHPNVSQFLLRSDDVATWSDLGAWSRMTGNDVSVVTENEFMIERKRN
jgi:TusA-related sulfurtransferase